MRAKAVSLSTAANWFWNMVLAFGVPPLLWNISYKMYYIFGAFNAAAFVHMALLAPETKGYTLEEMDEVFDSGRPAWKKREKKSRLDELEREIEAGNVKVSFMILGISYCICMVCLTINRSLFRWVPRLQLQQRVTTLPRQFQSPRRGQDQNRRL